MEMTEKITNQSRLEIYCYRTFLDFKNEEVLDFWRNNRNNKDVVRSVTRPFYDLIHSLSVPSGTITEKALIEKRKNRNKTLTKDHCYSPQFVYQMLMDNHELYVNDYEKYSKIFNICCTTIEITAEENRKLSSLKSNKRGKYEIYVPTDKKYQYLGIKLFKRNTNSQFWYNLPAKEVSNYIETPEELLEYEKKFLVCTNALM